MEKNPETRREVKVISSCLVPPESDTPRHPIWLSNLDVGSGWQFYSPVIYLFKNLNGDPGFFSAKKLKKALAKTLAVYYPHAGTLGYDGDGRIELRCTGEGVRFVDATCDSTIDEFGDFSPSQEIRSKLVPFLASADPPCPVVMLQVTRFKCGGVCLGVAWHHVVGDGTSCFSFINSWAAVTRGVDPTTITPPYLDRTLLRARSPPLVEYDHSDHDKSYTVDPMAQQHHAVSVAILHISKEQVAKLQAGNKKRATTFVAVRRPRVAVRLLGTRAVARRGHPPLFRRQRPGSSRPAPAAGVPRERYPLHAGGGQGPGADGEYTYTRVRGAEDAGVEGPSQRPVPSVANRLPGDAGGAYEGSAGAAADGHVRRLLAGAAHLRGRLRMGEAGVHGAGRDAIQGEAVHQPKPRGRRRGVLDGGSRGRAHGRVQGALLRRVGWCRCLYGKQCFQGKCP